MTKNFDAFLGEREKYREEFSKNVARGISGHAIQRTVKKYHTDTEAPTLQNELNKLFIHKLVEKRRDVIDSKKSILNCVDKNEAFFSTEYFNFLDEKVFSKIDDEINRLTQSNDSSNKSLN